MDRLVATSYRQVSGRESLYQCLELCQHAGNARSSALRHKQVESPMGTSLSTLV